MKKLLSVALLASLALGLALAGTANADEAPLTFTEPVEEVFENPCTGETVTLTGEQVIMVHELDDGAGGYHFKFTTVPHGVSGVGESGTQYHAIGAHSDYFSAGPGRATTFTFTVMFLVVSEGGDDNFLAKATIYFKVNARGDVTAELEEIRFECVG
jgi:hypothetical protein